MTPPPSCAECGALIARVRAEVDPQEIDLRFVAQCSHTIERDLASMLWQQHGYRWDVPVIDGVSLNAAERHRQVADEGYTPEHDAEHGDDGGLAWAAWAYIDRAIHTTDAYVPPPAMWPWGEAAWKAEATPVRRLVIANALISAEIDRRLHEQRVAPRATETR